MDQMKCVKEYVSMENSGRQHKYEVDGETYTNDTTSRDIKRMCLDKGRKEASRLIWGLSRNPTKLRQYLKTAEKFDHWKVAYRVGYEEYMNDLLETPGKTDRFKLQGVGGSENMQVNLFKEGIKSGTEIPSTKYIKNRFRVCNCRNGNSYAVTVPDSTHGGAGCNGVESDLNKVDRDTCKNGNLDFNKKCYQHEVLKNTEAVYIKNPLPGEEDLINPKLTKERRNFMWEYSNLKNADTYYDGQTIECPTK